MILIRVVLWAWFAVAFVAGHLLWLQRLPTPGVPAIPLALTGLVFWAYFRVAAWRDALDALDLRVLVLLHVTRLVGFYFLHLQSLGELPAAFATPAGYGDIVVAVLALLVVLVPMSPALRARALSIWNVIGFVDILLVILTAARLGRADPDSMQALTRLPLSLLPTFL